MTDPPAVLALEELIENAAPPDDDETSYTGSRGRTQEEEDELHQQQQQRGRSASPKKMKKKKSSRRRLSFPTSPLKKNNNKLRTAALFASSSPVAPAIPELSPTKRSLGSLLANLRGGGGGGGGGGTPCNNAGLGSVCSGTSSAKSRHCKKKIKKALLFNQRKQQQEAAAAEHLERLYLLQLQAKQALQEQKEQELLGKFLINVCPTDVLPKILAFAGPQMTSTLQRSNRFFSQVMNRQGTWRILCEDLYKWKPGEAEPRCWREHYRLNPCVPVDFKNILTAVEVVGGAKPASIYNDSNHNPVLSTNQRNLLAPDLESIAHKNKHDPVEIQSDLTVWLRPGQRYDLPKAVTILARSSKTKVRIETQELPEPILRQHVAQLAISATADTTSTSSAVHSSDIDNTSDNFDDQVQEYFSDRSDDDDHHPSFAPYKHVTPPAILVSSSHNNENRKNRRRNEPLFRVLRGQLVLRNVNLEHYSAGIDLWNGNAAIQVQPREELLSSLIMNSFPAGANAWRPMASANLYQVQVQSSSGRGIVTVDGGHLFVEDSYIHDCAATGVYVGGRNSKAKLTKTDILSNGAGNQCSVGGIARGHSGVYVEQGSVELEDCSVSRNSASGISVISAAMLGLNLLDFDDLGAAALDNNSETSETLLTMRRTDVLANAGSPLELPQQHQGQFPLMMAGLMHHHGDAAAAAAGAGAGRVNNIHQTSNVFDPLHKNKISPGGTPRPRSSVFRRQA